MEKENKNELTNELKNEKKGKKEKNENLIQAIKFFFFSVSAGIVQVASFTFLLEVFVKADFMQPLLESNELFAKIMTGKYGFCYIVALILSIIWNFTFNRKFTFKSAVNVPIAMAKAFAFYIFFAPASTIAGQAAVNAAKEFPFIEYLVLFITMVTNLILEFLWQKFYVFKEDKKDDTKADIKEEKSE
ncbi:MAG: hypothetical protein GX241_06765 [Ruminococcaceae bacterium]|nr:hypothetical protein [Oscillospiraceae bacterium]